MIISEISEKPLVRTPVLLMVRGACMEGTMSSSSPATAGAGLVKGSVSTVSVVLIIVCVFRAVDASLDWDEFMYFE